MYIILYESACLYMGRVAGGRFHSGKTHSNRASDKGQYLARLSLHIARILREFFILLRPLKVCEYNKTGCQQNNFL